MGLSRTTARTRRRRKRGQASGVRAPLAAARRAVDPSGPLRSAKGPLGAKGPLRGAKGPFGAKGPLRASKRRRPAVPRPSWKLIGLAGLAGVAATGVAVARSRRAHSELEPDELRERLHERLAEAERAGRPPDPPS